VIENLNSLDQRLFLLLNSFHATWLNEFMRFISGYVVWVPLMFFIFVLSYKKLGAKNTSYFAFFCILVIIACDATASSIIKNTFNRLRPCRNPELSELIHSFGQKCGGKYGFVSSHAANAFGLILFSVRTLNFSFYKAALLILIPVLISYSRIYLGVHYPGDILGGFIVAFIWSWAFSEIFKSFLRRESR